MSKAAGVTVVPRPFGCGPPRRVPFVKRRSPCGSTGRRNVSPKPSSTGDGLTGLLLPSVHGCGWAPIQGRASRRRAAGHAAGIRDSHREPRHVGTRARLLGIWSADGSPSKRDRCLVLRPRAGGVSFGARRGRRARWCEDCRVVLQSPHASVTGRSQSRVRRKAARAGAPPGPAPRLRRAYPVTVVGAVACQVLMAVSLQQSPSLVPRPVLKLIVEHPVLAPYLHPEIGR